MHIFVTIERDDRQTISNITMYLPDGEIICDFYGLTPSLIERVENDKTDWSADNPIFQQSVFLIYETPQYVSFEELANIKEDITFCGTGLELLHKVGAEYLHTKMHAIADKEATRYILIVTNKVDDFACYKLGAKEGDYEFDYPGLPTAMLDEIEQEDKDWNVMAKPATFLIYDVKEYTTPAELEGKKEDAVFYGTGLELLRELRKRNYD